MKLRYYGVDEIAKKYDMHKHTVRKRQKELWSGNLLPAEQVRVSGGGRTRQNTANTGNSTQHTNALQQAHFLNILSNLPNLILRRYHLKIRFG